MDKQRTSKNFWVRTANLELLKFSLRFSMRQSFASLIRPSKILISIQLPVMGDLANRTATATFQTVNRRWWAIQNCVLISETDFLVKLVRRTQTAKVAFNWRRTSDPLWFNLREALVDRQRFFEALPWSVSLKRFLEALWQTAFIWESLSDLPS